MRERENKITVFEKVKKKKKKKKKIKKKKKKKKENKRCFQLGKIVDKKSEEMIKEK